MGVGIVHDGDRRIFVRELVERLTELDVVLALGRGDRQREHRRIRQHLGEPLRMILARSQRVAGSGIIELAESDGFTGLRGTAFLERLPHHLVHAGNTAGIALLRVQRGCRRRSDPQARASTDILPPCAVLIDLQHIGHRIVAIGLDAEPLRRGLDIRRLVAQRLQQPQHAVGAGGDADQHRADQPIAQFRREIVEYLVARRRNILEQLLHQFVVVIGERLQHGEARGLLALQVLAADSSITSDAVCSL